MNHSDLESAKAQNAEERSDSIIVSFGAEWLDPLLKRAFSVVIRKRIPKTFTAKWMYFHVNSPVSAICGRGSIESTIELTAKEVVRLSKEITLPPAEITAYLGSEAKIGVYRLGVIQIANTSVTTEVLGQVLSYHPPQSFLILSERAKAIVDRLAGFHPNPAREAMIR